MEKTEQVGKKTKLIEIDYAEVFQELLILNQDVEVTDELKDKINNAKEGELLQVVKEIGSTPIVIKSVDVYDEDFLLKNFE